ncbi:hypothetical protein DRE_00238 [Drechslerella stenobrocha 248]|uniref:Uncharacterized protein n=1 Tax=Drechslerella stenobrocha 248 TaxID=1043628 RepID=W7I9C2_9PEZI|nr:hypothetical protein DRE_00238 [Drechslerella stenobrocha 248]
MPSSFEAAPLLMVRDIPIFETVWLLMNLLFLGCVFRHNFHTPGGLARIKEKVCQASRESSGQIFTNSRPDTAVIDPASRTPGAWVDYDQLVESNSKTPIEDISADTTKSRAIQEKNPEEEVSSFTLGGDGTTESTFIEQTIDQSKFLHSFPTVKYLCNTPFSLDTYRDILSPKKRDQECQIAIMQLSNSPQTNHPAGFEEPPHQLPSRSTSNGRNPLAEADGNQQPTPTLAWADIAVKSREQRLQTQAEMQELEDNFQRDLVERGLLVDKAQEPPEAQIASLDLENSDTNFLGGLERIKHESAFWAGDHIVTPKRSHTKFKDDSNLRQLVKIVAYHSTPEYKTRNSELIKQLESPPVDIQVPAPTVEPAPVETGNTLQSDIPFLEAKHREHIETVRLFEAKEREKREAEAELLRLRKYLAEWPEREERRLRDEKEQHMRNMAALEERFAREDREREAAKERALKLELDAKLAEIQKLEAEAELERQRTIRIKQEQLKAREEKLRLQEEARQREENQRREREESQRREREENERRVKEQKRREEEGRRRAQQEEQEKLERLRAQQQQKAASEKAQKDAQSFDQRISTIAASPNFEVERDRVVQNMISTMPYLNPEFRDTIMKQVGEQVAYKATYLTAMARMAPPNALMQRSASSMTTAFNQYTDIRFNMEMVLIRAGAIKSQFKSNQITEFKYKVNKKVSQVVGSAEGYMTTAVELVKMWQDASQIWERDGHVSIIAVDDFLIERQPKEGRTAPYTIFITLWDFMKTVLNKAVAEGPENQAMMKALAMVLNAVLGGRAKFWPLPAITSLVYARFWDFSNSMFGAMGVERDLGYKRTHGALESSTDVHRRAEVVASLWCQMAIVRNPNTKREPPVLIEDVLRCLEGNLNVPPYLRDELHYINVRTIMTIAPWTLRAHLSYSGSVALEQRIMRMCDEDAGSKLKGFASLLRARMESLRAEGYLNQMKGWGCDEWRYWSSEEITDINRRRADVEKVPPEQVQVDTAVTNGRILRLREAESRGMPTASQ